MRPRIAAEMNGFDVAKNLRMRYGQDDILPIAIAGVC